MNVLKALISWSLALYAVAVLVYLVLFAAAGHPLGLAFSEALAGPANLIMKAIDYFSTAVTGRAVLR